jgi:hypothetical protein
MNEQEIQKQQTNYEITTHLNRKKNNIDKKCLSKGVTELLLNHYNYNDGISVCRNGSNIAYNKVIDCLKIRCDVVNDKLGWVSSS